MTSSGKAKKSDRVTCRGCRTRYDTSGMQPGIPFSCRRCGEILYAPGKRGSVEQDLAEIPFGQAAVEMGFITTAQLTTALKLQRGAGKTRLRLGDILVEKGFLDQRQVSAILHRQGARVAFLIPGYEIVEKLGQGGMGAVYKGVHLASRKTVAIKILAEKLVRRPEFLERFHREARTAIKLDHPNIVKGYDEGRAGKTHYFVMEYVHGKSASRVLKKRKRFGERRAMDIVRQIAEALDYAHGRNILHRDIKPDNIMLTREGKAKLADYGLVKYMDDVNVAGLTTEGQIMGTPNYISPEQASGKGDLDIRSDIYSLGATQFHLLTGRPPYTGKSVGVIMGLHISGAVPDPRQVHRGLSSDASAIVMRMMAKKLDERYQTPRQLLEDLERYFQRKPTRAGSLHPSGEAKVTPAPWDTVTPGAADTMDIGEEEDLLESLGEDHAQLSYLAPVLLGVGAALLVLGVIAAVYVLYSRRDDRDATGGNRGLVAGTTDDIGEISVRQRPGPISNGGDGLEAAVLYKAALELEGDARMRKFQELVKRYPRNPLAQLVSKEMAQYRQAERARQQRESKRRQQQRELAALRAYNQALDARGRGRAAFAAALRRVWRRYPATRGARQAREREARLRSESVGNGKPAQQEQLARRQREEEIARLEFVDAYLEALESFSLGRARRLARELAADKRFSSLRQLGKDCQADVQCLQLVYPAVRAGLEQLKRQRLQTTLLFGKGNAVKGRVVEVKDNEVGLLLPGNLVYRQKLTALADSQVESLLRLAYKAKNPPADLVLMLFNFARGNRNAATTLFNRVYRRDPRRRHHHAMLDWQ